MLSWRFKLLIFRLLIAFERFFILLKKFSAKTADALIQKVQVVNSILESKWLRHFFKVFQFVHDFRGWIGKGLSEVTQQGPGNEEQWKM